MLNQKGSAILYVMVFCGLTMATFMYIFERKDSLIKNIGGTILSYQEEAKVFEIRSLLTQASICETSLKGLRINQQTAFTLKSNASTNITINQPGEEVTVKTLRLVPSTTPTPNEFNDARIEVTLETRPSAKKVSQRVMYVPFNFYIDKTTYAIKECLGEKTPESFALFNTTIAEQRKAICIDALKGSINSQGRCNWSW